MLSGDLPVHWNNEQLIAALQAWLAWLTLGHNLVGNISVQLCHLGNLSVCQFVSTSRAEIPYDNKTNQAGSRLVDKKLYFDNYHQERPV